MAGRPEGQAIQAIHQKAVLMRFQLCEADQKRFGLGEWLSFDLRAITLKDMTWLSDKFGFDPEDWPNPWLGELTLEQAGDPDAVPKPPKWRNQAMCWMLLRQNGVDASWDDAAEVHDLLIRTEREPSDPEPESPGKEPTPANPSAPSAASTTRRSTTSTASRRKKST
jgi:hypothetical protein